MRIAICGTGSDIPVKELQKYYGYRGTACYCYDYLALITRLVDTCEVVLSQDDIQLDAISKVELRGPFMDVAEDHLPRIADTTINKVTRQWLDLKMHHVTILYNVPESHAQKVDSDFRVFASYDEKKCRTLGSGFDDCAVSRIFHVVVDLNKHVPEEAASLIGDGLHDKMITAIKKDLE